MSSAGSAPAPSFDRRKGRAIGLDTPSAIARRVAAPAQPRSAPLEALRTTWSLAGNRRLPHVDPADGGIAARLILPETPGPGGDGVRFVSRDNPTGTARNLTRFLAAAGIARGDTLLWNTVPWIVHAPAHATARSAAARSWKDLR